MSLLDDKSTHGRGRDRLSRAHSTPEIEMEKSCVTDEADQYNDPVSEYDAPDEIAAREAAASARSICGRMCKFSRIYDAEKEKQLPKLERSELVLGKMLGQGGFSDVYEIRAIHLKKSEASYSSTHIAESVEKPKTIDSDDDEFFDRKFLSRHALRKSGESRYAIKYLSPEITSGKEVDGERFITGAIDIALEIKFLCSFEHPNIVKMRGQSSSGLAGFAQNGGFFLIIDRLYDILERRLPKWHASHPKYRGETLQAKLLSPFSRNKARESFLVRLHAAYDIASALEYLHNRGIVYRDLKPDNIGFDVRDDVKIFDFGLARELSQIPDEVGPRGAPMYEMTPNTGTQRYMAPEVSTGKPYNLSADTYSFGILLWQMLKIEIPFKRMTRLVHIEQVMKGSVRPKIKKIWPPKIKQLLEGCWDENMFDRPSMADVTKILKAEILSLSDPGLAAQEISENMQKHRRRSTYVGKVVKTKNITPKEDLAETTTRV